jgi:hypothetical protein
LKEIAVADPGFDDQQLGTAGFRWAIAQLPVRKQAAATHLADWAVVVEKEGLAHLEWVRRRRLGVLQKLLLPPHITWDRRKCLAIFTCGTESVYLQLWRSVFEVHARGSIEKIQAILGAPIGTGTRYHDIPEELLYALADAYHEAAMPRTGAGTTAG